MRNLRNLGRKILTAASPAIPTACCWDVSTNSVICAFGPSENDSLVTLQRWKYSAGAHDVAKDCATIAAWDAPCPSPDLACDRILDIHYLQDCLGICLIFAGGDIVLVREEPDPGFDKIEIVGSVDAGIAAAAWAPDEELLVILTNAETFLYMSRDFESITDLVLSTEDLKASKHVSVGWGKAETQFRGKGAKALRDPTMPEKVDEGLFSTYDGKQSTISWRGDGAYVAVNSPQASNRRVIRVYSREGELDGVSEPVDYMEGGLSWRPAGNLIASTQRLEDRIDVIFFERNGLRHGQFSLRLSKEDMETWATSIDLKWNVDSTVLAVSFLDRIQLWTMGNYHHYLKQEIRCQPSSLDQRPPVISWHPEQPLLLLTSHNGYLQKFEYSWRVASGSKAPPFDNGLVSVIDGKNLKVTPMRLSNVPPPMALTELSMSDSIIDVAYYDTLSDNKFLILFAILDQTNLSVYVWNLKEKPLSSLCLKASIPLISSHAERHPEERQIFPRQVAFSAPDTLLVAIDSDAGSCVSCYNLSEQDLELVNSMHYESTRELISAVGNQSCSSHLWLDNKGIVHPEFSELPPEKGHNDVNAVSRDLIKDVPTNLESLITLNFPTHGEAEDIQTIAFGLRRSGMLFANKQCVAKDCTSFVVSPSRLIFTTSQHLLKFVHLAAVEGILFSLR